MPAHKANIHPAWYFTVLLLFTAFEFIRPQESYLRFLSPLKLPALLSLTLVFIFLSNTKEYLKQEYGYKLLIYFWLYISFTIIYATNTRATHGSSMLLMWASIAFIFPMAVIIKDRKDLFKFINWWILIQTVLALIVLKQGGRGPGGFLEDENDVCLALVMALPYPYFMSKVEGISFKTKLLYLVSVLLIISAALVTSSRGGALGLVAVLGIFVLMSKSPVKNLSVIVLSIVLLGGVVISTLPESYVEDMSSMTSSEDATGDERLYSWSIAWVMFLKNPVFGVGAGNYPWTNNLYYKESSMWEPGRKFLGGRAAHSVYFTLISDLGGIGIILYLSLLKLAYSRAKSIKNKLHNAVDHENALKFILLGKALIASLVGFMVCGTFISVLYYPFFWYLLGMILVSFKVANDSFLDSDGNKIQLN